MPQDVGHGAKHGIKKGCPSCPGWIWSCFYESSIVIFTVYYWNELQMVEVESDLSCSGEGFYEVISVFWPQSVTTHPLTCRASPSVCWCGNKMDTNYNFKPGVCIHEETLHFTILVLQSAIYSHYILEAISQKTRIIQSVAQHSIYSHSRGCWLLT